MRYNDTEIRRNILTFIDDTEQHELRYVIAFAIGYYGYITGQIWRVICELIVADVIKV